MTLGFVSKIFGDMGLSSYLLLLMKQVEICKKKGTLLVAGDMGCLTL